MWTYQFNIGWKRRRKKWREKNVSWEEKLTWKGRKKWSFTNNSLRNTKKLNYLIFSPFLSLSHYTKDEILLLKNNCIFVVIDKRNKKRASWHSLVGYFPIITIDWNRWEIVQVPTYLMLLIYSPSLLFYPFHQL